MDQTGGVSRLGPVLLLIVVAVGWLDWVTGVEIGLSLLYIIPIGWAAWCVGAGWTAACVVLASTAWLWAELFGREEVVLPVVLWNGFTRVVIYGAVGAMLTAIRTERRELRELNQRLAEALGTQTELARTDALTGLSNARSFSEELRRRIEEEQGGVCLAYLDLDDFKSLNDQYGHFAGDDALREVGQALRGSLRRPEGTRQADLIARLGGDEFAILFCAIDPETARQVSARLVARVGALRERYPLSRLGASIGIACTRAGIGPDELIRRADAAMYRAKRAGKGTVVVD